MNLNARNSTVIDEKELVSPRVDEISYTTD